MDGPGRLFVQLGGFASETSAFGGAGVDLYSGGTANSTFLNNAVMNVSSGAKAEATYVSSAGVQSTQAACAPDQPSGFSRYDIRIFPLVAGYGMLAGHLVCFPFCSHDHCFGNASHDAGVPMGSCHMVCQRQKGVT